MKPSWSAWQPASTMCGGVAKPGSPTARLIAPGTRGVMSNMRRMSDGGTARARALTRSVVLSIEASLDAREWGQAPAMTAISTR